MLQSKSRLLELNVKLAETLKSKGVIATADETTTALINKVKNISGASELAEYSQVNPIVAKYMSEVTYDTSDYTISNILAYSYAETDYNKGRPTGYDVNISDSGVLHLADDISVIKMDSTSGVNTLLNTIPNAVAHWWNTVNDNVKQSGTIKPTGQVRMINTTANNVRDLGGWTCDGGTIKYGKLFRGGLLSDSDKDVLVNQLKIKHDLDLRGLSDNGGITSSPLGNSVNYTCTTKYVWYSLDNTDDWTLILSTIFNAVSKNEPVIFHCAAGCDRTGTVACIIESILGVAQNDIDKDFELSSFAIHPNARRRTDDNWQNLINAINAITTGDTFRDKVINWVGSLGFTDDDVNTFRQSMINGTPENVTIEEIVTPVEPEEVNLFNADTANYNCRLGSNNDLRTGFNGSVVTDFIDITDVSTLKISGTFVVSSNYNYEGKICYYDSNDSPIGSGAWNDYSSMPTIDVASVKSSHTNAVKMRFWFCIKNDVAITADDCADIKIISI